MAEEILTPEEFKTLCLKAVKVSPTRTTISFIISVYGPFPRTYEKLLWKIAGREDRGILRGGRDIELRKEIELELDSELNNTNTGNDADEENK